jgi:hypothetical protein
MSIRYKFTITGNSFEEIGDKDESGSIRWDPQHIEYDMEET